MNKNAKTLQVIYRGRLVGNMALTPDMRVAFQYDENWIKNGFSISPFTLPLNDSVFVPEDMKYDGLFGVFADSLPDSWGRLVLDRFLKSKGINPQTLNQLDRLSIIGKSGMGALEYIPEYQITDSKSNLELDELAKLCESIMESRQVDNIDDIFVRAGSSGGARPKAFTTFENKEWIVKFPYSKDLYNSGKLEYEYSVKAKACKIEMTETRLFQSKKGEAYFGIERFDRPKVHMLSAAAMLEIDFERSSMDYADLFKLTRIVTHDSKNDIDNLFRRMVFNVYMDNQDDHLKNFSYIYDEKLMRWKLSPAYDLTRVETGYGEHTLTVNGKGKDISDTDIISVGTNAGLKKSKCIEILEEMKTILL